jgi:hypothetical protein
MSLHRTIARVARFAAWTIAVCAAVPAPAETLILKNGTFVDGEITLQTSTTVRIKTRFGERSFARKEIERVIESVTSGDSSAVNKFNELPAAHRVVLNAQALYDLKKYDEALQRIEPLRDYQEDKAVRMRVDWLIIELNERLGRWDAARKLLTEKKDAGAPPEKIRAKAHLDIFEVNPEFDLRFVGERPAREFLRDDALRNRAKEPQALSDDAIMRRALEEYCEQLLVADKLSVKAFGEKLKAQATYDAIKKAGGAGDFVALLPYQSDLKAAEAALFKAQAILGDYGIAYELDLVRMELGHLIVVAIRFLGELFASSPENFNPPSDPRNRQLTAEGRREWQRRSDLFLDNAKPVIRLIEYMIKRAERYPRELRDFREISENINERLTQSVKAVKKSRDRTHA